VAQRTAHSEFVAGDSNVQQRVVARGAARAAQSMCERPLRLKLHLVLLSSVKCVAVARGKKLRKSQLCLFVASKVKRWDTTVDKLDQRSVRNIENLLLLRGGSVAEWLACWTQAQKGLGSNRSRDAVG